MRDWEQCSHLKLHLEVGSITKSKGALDVNPSRRGELISR